MRAVLLVPAIAIAALNYAPCRAQTLAGDQQYFRDWPAGASPREIGVRLAENWAKRPFIFEAGRSGRYDEFVQYSEVGTWYGALSVARLTGDSALEQRLIRKFDTLRTPQGAKHISAERHVDFSIFGALPLELFLDTGDSTLLKSGLRFADLQWSDPTPDGITREARYWIDDMYMVPLLQVQAYRATKNRVYLDRAALAMIAYLDRLQQPNGLFYHGEGTPFFWGRGNGWMAAGMTELLRSLPADSPRRAAILAGYRRMMATLLQHQAPNGMWRQLIDKPELWTESSGSGMFAFAMVTGVKQGWLDAAMYGPAARRAWLALVQEIDAEGNVRDICVGTGKASDAVGADLAAQYAYYVARPRQTGDTHGQAPVLWTAAALLEIGSPVGTRR